MADKKHEAGSHIALRSLATEIEAITGQSVDLTRTEKRKASSVLTQNIKNFNFSGVAVLCIDCSGSMEGKEFLEARRGSKKFCREALEKGYSVGLVGFSSEAWSICDVTDNIEKLESAVERLEIKGSTNMADAIRIARSLLVEHGKSQGTVCIITDGVPDDIDAAFDKALKTEGEADTTKSLGIGILCLGIEGAYMPVLDRIASEKELSEQCSTSEFGNRIGMMASHLQLAHKKK